MIDVTNLILLGTLAGLAIADVVLHRTDRKLLTEAMREHKYVTLAVLLSLALHVLDFELLRRYDPYKHAGRVVARWN